MKKCEICQKSYITTWRRKKLRSRYNPTVRKKKKPNLQKKTIQGKKIWICTECLKKLTREGKII